MKPTRLTLAALSIVALCFAGCAQNTESKSPQATAQRADTDQAAAGSTTSLNQEPVSLTLNFDRWGGGGVASSQPSTGGSEDPAGDAAGGRASKVNGALVSIGAVNLITNTTVHSGGSTTGAQSTGGQAANPNSAPNIAATLKPNASVAANGQAAFGPGSSTQGNANSSAAAEQSTATATLTPQQTAELTTLQQKVKSGQPLTPAEATQLLDLLKLKSAPPATGAGG